MSKDWVGRKESMEGIPESEEAMRIKVKCFVEL